MFLFMFLTWFMPKMVGSSSHMSCVLYICHKPMQKQKTMRPVVCRQLQLAY